MMALTTKLALERYETACATGDGWREAADALAAVLKAKTTKPAKAHDLAAPIKIGKGKFWGDFVITWEDGTDTLVRGVVYDRAADRWAAAYQGADRLRRMRGRHAWEGEAGAPPRWHVLSGIRRETPEYLDYAYKRRPLPGCVSILAEDGEVFEHGT